MSQLGLPWSWSLWDESVVMRKTSDFGPLGLDGITAFVNDHLHLLRLVFAGKKRLPSQELRE
jgi:hypothetical protein